MDNTNLPAVPAGQTNGTADQGTANEPNSEVAEAIKAVEARFDEKTRGLYAKINRLEQAAKQPPQPTTDEPATVKEELVKLRAEIRQEKEEAERATRESAIQTAISSHGIDSDNAELLEAFVNQKFGQNIKVEKKQVFYLDPTTDERTPVKDFIGGIIRTKGDKFKPAVQNVPSGRGLKPGNSSAPMPIRYQDMPQEERLKLSPADAFKIINAEMTGDK